jgi:hypothetical protein
MSIKNRLIKLEQQQPTRESLIFILAPSKDALESEYAEFELELTEALKTDEQIIVVSDESVDHLQIPARVKVMNHFNAACTELTTFPSTLGNSNMMEDVFSKLTGNVIGVNHGQHINLEFKPFVFKPTPRHRDRI